jgi:hypothetical protein
MKQLFVFLILIFLSLKFFAQSDAKIGMSLEEVKKMYPKCKLSNYENTITLSFNDTLYNLASEWGYRFENNKLNWIFFHKYIDKIEKSNFDKCFFATHNLIKDYIKILGKPDTTIIGDTTFVDPYEKHHWGYDVIEARWNNYNGMKVKVGFTFFGGKGDYNFIVEINYFDKSYPYFD